MNHSTIPHHAHLAAEDLIKAGFTAVTYQPTHGPHADTITGTLIGWAVGKDHKILPAIITALVTTTQPHAAILAVIDQARDTFGTRRHTAYDAAGQWFAANSALTRLSPVAHPPAWTATGSNHHGLDAVPAPASSTLIAHALKAAAARAYRAHAAHTGPGPRARAHAADDLRENVEQALGVIAGHITLDERTTSAAVARALDWATAASDTADAAATAAGDDRGSGAGVHDLGRGHDQDSDHGAAGDEQVHVAAHLPDTLHWDAPTTPLVQLVRRIDHQPHDTAPEAVLHNLRPTSSVRPGQGVILPAEIEGTTGRIIDHRDTYAGPAYLVNTTTEHTSHLRVGDLLLAGGPTPVAHLITASDAGRKFSRHFLALRGAPHLLARIWAYTNTRGGAATIAAATCNHPLGSLSQQAALLRAIAIPTTPEPLAADEVYAHLIPHPADQLAAEHGATGDAESDSPGDTGAGTAAADEPTTAATAREVN